LNEIWYRLVTISMTSPKHTCLRTIGSQTW